MVGVSTQHWGLPGCPSLLGTLSQDKELWDGGQVHPDLPACPRTPQHPVLPVARRCFLWSGHCSRVTHATISLLPCHRVLPGTGRDPSGWQHGSILGTSSSVTPSHSAATQGRDILTDACTSPDVTNPAVWSCLLPPPSLPPPQGPPPADLKGCRPSAQDLNTTLPALCNGVAPQPCEQRPAPTGSFLPPPNASSHHRCPGDTLGSLVPSRGLDLPSCATLCRSGQKTSLNHWCGKMNVLASSQATVTGKC